MNATDEWKVEREIALAVISQKAFSFFFYFPGVLLSSLDGGVGAIKAADVGNNAGNSMIDRMQVRRAKNGNATKKKKGRGWKKMVFDSDVKGKDNETG